MHVHAIRRSPTPVIYYKITLTPEEAETICKKLGYAFGHHWWSANPNDDDAPLWSLYNILKDREQ